MSIRRALFPNALSAIPENEVFNANAKFKRCILVKSFSHIYICVSMYIFMESSFPKDDL